MDKFNELKDLMNASVHTAAAMPTDKQSNGADVTIKPEYSQQPLLSQVAPVLLKHFNKSRNYF